MFLVDLFLQFVATANVFCFFIICNDLINLCDIWSWNIIARQCLSMTSITFFASDGVCMLLAIQSSLQDWKHYSETGRLWWMSSITADVKFTDCKHFPLIQYTKKLVHKLHIHFVHFGFSVRQSLIFCFNLKTEVLEWCFQNFCFLEMRL